MVFGQLLDPASYILYPSELPSQRAGLAKVRAHPDLRSPPALVVSHLAATVIALPWAHPGSVPEVPLCLSSGCAIILVPLRCGDGL